MQELHPSRPRRDFGEQYRVHFSHYPLWVISGQARSKCLLSANSGHFTRLLLWCADILTKALVRIENNIFAILSFKSSDGKMAARDRLEVVDKCVIDGVSSERTYDRNSLRSSLL